MAALRSDPPMEKLHVVHLTDKGLDWDQAQVHFKNAYLWAREHCPSYAGYEIRDVSDFSMREDLVAQYVFRDSEDVVLFRLTWC